MTKHIIVGVDDSDTAAHAAQVAADLAVSLGGVLHVITACDDLGTTEVGIGTDVLRISRTDEATEVARSVAVRIAQPGLTIDSGARIGRPHEVLIEEAERYDDVLIVVGNRRMRGPGRMLGSVANSVTHSAPCDVYVVKTT